MCHHLELKHVLTTYLEQPQLACTHTNQALIGLWSPALAYALPHPTVHPLPFSLGLQKPVYSRSLCTASPPTSPQRCGEKIVPSGKGGGGSNPQLYSVPILYSRSKSRACFPPPVLEAGCKSALPLPVSFNLMIGCCGQETPTFSVSNIVPRFETTE